MVMRRAAKVARSAFGAAVLGAVVVACAGESNTEVLPPVVLAMLETTPPAYDDGEQQIFQVGKEVPLPFRRPEDEERPRGDVDPYPRPPFHLAKDSRITVHYTLSNLEDRERVVELLLDPWNEFVRYAPGLGTAGEDEVLPNLSGIDRWVILPPKGRVQGILTPDDMVELAVDLTTAMTLERRPPDPQGPFAGPALFNRAFNAQNRSSEPDPVLVDWLPRSRNDVAAITGFDLGLRTAAAAKIAVELVVDVEDLRGERIVMEGGDGTKLNRPGNVLTPPAAPARM